MATPIGTFLKNYKSPFFSGQVFEDFDDWIKEMDEYFELLEAREEDYAWIAR